MKHDSVGRQIRPGDGVNYVRYDWQVSTDGTHLRSPGLAPARLEAIPSENLTITHRSGEPIDEISPLVKDRAGKVIERGVRVNTRPDDNPGTVLCVSREAEGVTVSVRWDSGNVNEWSADLLHLLPPEPEYTETTLTVRHPKNVDARKTIAAVAELEVRDEHWRRYIATERDRW